MAHEDASVRATKAYRRVVAAARKLAKQNSQAELGEAVAGANHQDGDTREMRRYEALASLLEALVADEEQASTEKPATKSTAKSDKADKSE